MIAELAVLGLTRAPLWARRFGLPADSVALWSRGLRLRKYWAEHEARSQASVLRAMKTLPNKRKALVLGSGHARDIPLTDLSRTFEQVILADAVHLPMIRWRARRLGNVTCQTIDLTGQLAFLLGLAEKPDNPLAPFLADHQIDLVISANCLSQLPYCPGEWLDKGHVPPKPWPQGWQQTMIRDHLDALLAFSGHVTLLTDTAMTETNAKGEITERLDLMHGLVLPDGNDRWDWPVAPRGEISRSTAYTHHVRAFDDLKSAGITRSSCAQPTSTS